MHLVITDIPTSGPASEWRHALEDLPLPRLAQLLTRLQPGARIELDEFNWAMPHEVLLARAVGLPEMSTPWAAWETGLTGTPCAWIHPTHWHVGVDHITMGSPQELGFSEALSREHLAVLGPFFAEVGITLDYHEPLRWLARGEVFADMGCASLDRAVGRNIDAWMPEAAHPAGAQMRRLQNEVQMLLYQHALTDAASAHGRLPMNSFWVSGAGKLDTLPVHPAPRLQRTLQPAIWAADTQAYRQAWQTLDADALNPLLELLDAGQPVRLSLCSDSVAQTFETAPNGFGQKLKRLFGGRLKADWSRWL